MVLQTGQRSTFNDTVGLKLDLSDLLPIITDPFDVPLFQRLAKRAPTLAAVKHEWQEEPLVGNSDQLNGAYTTPGTTITVDDFTKFKKGYVLQIEDEQFRVVTTPSANPITVTPAYAGTTGANHADNTVVSIIGYAVTDGADPEPFSTTDRVNKFNLQQVYQELIEVTDLDEWTQIYGVKDKFGHEVEKWLKTLAIRAEKSVLFGRRNEDTTNKTRTMGGLHFFITTNVTDAAAAAVSEALVNAELQDIYTAGGQADLLAVSPTQKRKISSLIAAAQRWYPRPGADESVGVSAESYVSDFGRVEIMMDRNITAAEIEILSTPLISIVQGMPFTLENLAKTGTSRKSQIVGWFSLEVKAENRHSRLKNLSVA